MDSQPSEPRLFECREALARLREAAHRGDWQSAQVLAESIPQPGLPTTPDDLAEHLADLKETLVTAKTWRAGLMASLVRLTAADRFESAGREVAPQRQISVVSTGF